MSYKKILSRIYENVPLTPSGGPWGIPLLGALGKSFVFHHIWLKFLSGVHFLKLLKDFKSNLGKCTPDTPRGPCSIPSRVALGKSFAFHHIWLNFYQA